MPHRILPTPSTLENPCSAIASSGVAREVPERIANVAVCGGVHLHLAGLEVDEAHVARIDLESTDERTPHLDAHALIAELGLRGEVLDARPVLTVIERHVIDVEPDQEKTAAVAKRKLAYRAIEHRITVSDVAGDERAIEPLQRRRRQQSVRQVKPCIARIAVVD